MVDTVCCAAAVIGAVVVGIVWFLMKFATPVSIWSAGRNVRKGLQNQHQTQVVYQAAPLPPPQPPPPPCR